MKKSHKSFIYRVIWLFNSSIIPLLFFSLLGLGGFTFAQNIYHVEIESITNDELQITGYEIYDIMGRKLCTSPNPSKGGEQAPSLLERAGGEVLPNGIYILKIQTNQGIIIKKIMNNE